MSDCLHVSNFKPVDGGLNIHDKKLSKYFDVLGNTENPCGAE